MTSLPKEWHSDTVPSFLFPHISQTGCWWSWQTGSANGHKVLPKFILSTRDQKRLTRQKFLGSNYHTLSKCLGKKCVSVPIIKGQVESLGFDPFPNVMKPPILVLGWCQRRTSGKLGISLSLSNNEHAYPQLLL